MDTIRKKLKVLHLMKGNAQIYGAERVLLAELEHLRRLDVDVHFVMLDELRQAGCRDVMAQAVEALGVRVIRVPVDKQFSLSMVRAVKDVFVSERATAKDGIVIHSHGYKADVIGLAAARWARVPIMGEISGWLFPKDDYTIRFYEWLDAQALKQMDRAVVLVEHYKRLCLDMGFNAKNLVTIPSGVDVEKLKAAAGQKDLRQALSLRAAQPVIGMLTRLSHEKGVDIFLRALSFVVRRHPHVQAVIYGTGPEEAALKQLANDLEITPNVIWAGYVAEAVDALLSLDVVVQSSRIEALPQTLMEAMVMQRPVVVTPVGGCPELVVDGETGFVAPSMDPAIIASCICRLLENPQLAQQMGQAGAARIDANYTMQHWARRTIALYEALV